jgi:hypothetical protein
MAILAGVWGQPTLAAVHEGAWQHFAEDVSNQIHTVQVGIYAFFVDAKVQSILDWCWSLGGLLRPASAFRDIGIGIVANHHFLSEDYFEKRMAEVLSHAPRQSPRTDAVLAALGQDDPALLQQLQVAQREPDWAQAMMGRLSDVSSREGADLYRVTRGFAQRRLSQAGVHFIPGQDDPDAFVQPLSDPDVAAALNQYFDLYRRAFGRAGTMLRAWEKQYRTAVQQPGADQAAVARIVRRQLHYWAAAEARRQVWLADKALLNPPLAAR